MPVWTRIFCNWFLPFYYYLSSIRYYFRLQRARSEWESLVFASIFVVIPLEVGITRMRVRVVRTLKCAPPTLMRAINQEIAHFKRARSHTECVQCPY